MSVQDLARLYDDLGRFQWWRRRFSRAGATEGLDMHKVLRDDGAGVSNLNAWLWERVRDPEPRRVLDLGTGFGATLFDWAARVPAASFVGLSLSPYQVARARAVARRLEVQDRVTFVEADNANYDAGERSFDLIVSIETLFHARDLRETLQHLGQRLEPGGRIVLVEDMLLAPEHAEHPSARELSELWATPTLHAVGDFRRALDRSGLELVEEHDLSGHVVHGAAADLVAKKAKLARWIPRCPLRSVREVLRAFQGGFALEELHAAGVMSYHAWIARRGKVER